MFIEAIIIGLLIGFIRGGRVLNIGNMDIRGWLLVVIAFVLQMIPIFFGFISVVSSVGHYISFFAMLLMLVAVLVNVEKKGFWIIALGAIMNLAAMGFNGLLMPVSLDGLAYIGFADIVEAVKLGDVVNYISIENTSHWSLYLGKILTLPRLYPFAKIISFGDIIMSIGLFWFTQSEMIHQHHFKSRGKMVHYSINSKW